MAEMRQLHAYIVRSGVPGGLRRAIDAGGSRWRPAGWPSSPSTAGLRARSRRRARRSAIAIPDSAWIAPTADPAVPGVPLAGAWPDWRSRRRRPRGSGSRRLCATPPVLDDPRDYAVAARRRSCSPAGQWQLQVQVVHWRGDTCARRPNGARPCSRRPVAALRDCQSTAPLTSPSITTDEPDRLAAVISVRRAIRCMHQYLLADPAQQHHHRTGACGRRLPPQRALAGGGRRAGPRRDGARRCATAYLGSCR